MDSIFEEDADEVGGEIEAYCPSPRCKADTTHTIISMYEDEVRRVQCVVCGEVHAYRKPRGDGIDEASDGAAKKASSRKLTWEDALARTSDADLANTRPFTVRDAYEEGDVIHHQQYDIGFVTSLLPDNKIEVMFRDSHEPRILVHNRSDLASRMPDISEIPVPREVKKKKRTKKAEAAQPVPARSKAEVEAAVQRARDAAHMRSDEAQKTADERNKKLKAEAKKAKGGAKAAAKPSAKAAAKPAKAKAKAAKPAKKPAKAKAAKPAKKPAKAAKKKAAKKPTAKKTAAKGSSKSKAKKKGKK
jgi:pyruvate/2-oxoglutarate dehydrogenase complex dihydrolipoamide acyltransferase (E2) component